MCFKHKTFPNKWYLTSDSHITPEWPLRDAFPPVLVWICICEDRKYRWHRRLAKKELPGLFFINLWPSFYPKPRDIYIQLKTLMKVKSWKPSTFVSLSHSQRTIFFHFSLHAILCCIFFHDEKNHLSVFGISRNARKCGILFFPFVLKGGVYQKLNHSQSLTKIEFITLKIFNCIFILKKVLLK